jgi:hypothetical protein
MYRDQYLSCVVLGFGVPANVSIHLCSKYCIVNLAILKLASLDSDSVRQQQRLVTAFAWGEISTAVPALQAISMILHGLWSPSRNFGCGTGGSE